MQSHSSSHSSPAASSLRELTSSKLRHRRVAGKWRPRRCAVEVSTAGAGTAHLHKHLWSSSCLQRSEQELQIIIQIRSLSQAAGFCFPVCPRTLCSGRSSPSTRRMLCSHKLQGKRAESPPTAACCCLDPVSSNSLPCMGRQCREEQKTPSEQLGMVRSSCNRPSTGPHFAKLVRYSLAWQGGTKLLFKLSRLSLPKKGSRQGQAAADTITSATLLQ